MFAPNESQEVQGGFAGSLNALARGHLRFDRKGNPLPHGEDIGREEITRDRDDAYEFRSLTILGSLGH